MRCMFAQFGNIIDIVSRRTYKLRGQAWVVFENEKDAADALKFMQGFPFFNKPIVSF
jgi:U2 small nuclear ribonucleoprotein B''